MSLTFIDTNKLPKQAIDRPRRGHRSAERGAVRRAITCVGSLRWLKRPRRFKPDAANKHQLIYLMEGKGRIRLNDKDYNVEKGAGIYLGPSESATIQAASWRGAEAVSSRGAADTEVTRDPRPPAVRASPKSRGDDE